MMNYKQELDKLFKDICEINRIRQEMQIELEIIEKRRLILRAEYLANSEQLWLGYNGYNNNNK